jgi:RNA polymerase sigma factor (sigma-70 family)
MTDSQTLLADYVANGSEPAFRELVGRYLDFVYSTALRLVEGDRALAEDVTQIVFTDLARLAQKLSREVMLGAWLHRHTCFVAAKTLRSNRRRQARERQAVEMNALQDHTESNLAQMAPMLDNAINHLRADDRTAIVLRFFEQRDFRSVGEALGSNEEAARKRVSRALEKLHSFLKRRGLTVSAAALGTALAGEAVTAAPAGMAVSVSSAALASATVGAGASLTFMKIMAMTKLKAGIVSAIVVASVAGSLVVQNQARAKLREHTESLRRQTDQLAQVQAENERLSNLVAQSMATRTVLDDKFKELLKLRGEVGGLRRQLAETSRIREKTATVPQAEQMEINQAAEEFKTQAIARMTYAKNWVLAFHLFAEANQGQFPTNLDLALPFLSEEAKAEHNLAPGQLLPNQPIYGLTPDRFELMYQGSLDSLTNPSSTIVLREKEAWQTSDGGSVRAYGFADGHSEIHRTEDGNFETWESEHTQKPGEQ